METHKGANVIAGGVVHPFGNQLGVTSAPFEQSLSVFDSIDRGT